MQKIAQYAQTYVQINMKPLRLQSKYKKIDLTLQFNFIMLHKLVIDNNRYKGKFRLGEVRIELSRNMQSRIAVGIN